jgi:ribosome-binding protein aMBF1 (putative translation factor)
MAKQGIKGYESYYYIDEMGIIYNRFNKVCKIHISKNGYCVVNFCVNYQTKQKYIHRIIAESFIPNPNKYKTVNHINGIKTDNRIENLEWLSLEDNLRHAFNHGLKNNEHSKLKILDTLTNKEYKGINEAAINIGISYSHLSKMLNGKRQNNTTLIVL